MKSLWSKNDFGIGLWCTLDDPKVQELAAGAGFDYLTIDLQHGFNSWGTLCNSMRALHTADATIFARVPANREDYITRVLDAGADGVVVPFVESKEDAERAVAACRYPTNSDSVIGGTRSYGPLWADYDGSLDTDAVNENVLCVVQIETVKGVKNAEAIASVPGVSALYVGPYDLALSLGMGGLTYRDSPVIHEAFETVIGIARKHGLAAGMHCNGPEMAAYWQKRGASMLTSALDSTTIAGAFSALAADVRSATAIEGN